MSCRLRRSGCDSGGGHLGPAGHRGVLLPAEAQEGPQPVGGPRPRGAVGAGHARLQQHHQACVMSPWQPGKYPHPAPGFYLFVILSFSFKFLLFFLVVVRFPETFQFQVEFVKILK